MGRRKKISKESQPPTASYGCLSAGDRQLARTEGKPPFQNSGGWKRESAITRSSKIGGTVVSALWVLTIALTFVTDHSKDSVVTAIAYHSATYRYPLNFYRNRDTTLL
jgi:hypothetical protein